MKSFSIGIRFILSIVIFSVPIMILMFYMWRVNQDVLDFSGKELEGVKHLLAGSVLKVESFEKHLNSLNGKNVEQAEWNDLFKRWEQYFVTLDDVKFDKVVALSSIEAYVNATEDQKKNGQLLLKAIQNTRQVREGIADSHNIMLDPDSDSFYVMDSVILQLPKMLELQAELLAEIYSESNAEPTSEKRARIAEIFALYKDSHTKLGENLRKIKEFDNVYYGELAEFQNNYSKYEGWLNSQYPDLINPMSSFVNDGGEIKKLLPGLMRTFKANSDYHYTMQKDFEKFIEHRYNVIQREMFERLAFAGLAMVFAILFSSYLGVTISSTLRTFHVAVDTLKKEARESLEIGQSLIQSSRKVSDSSSEQAAAIEETSASLEEISSMVKNNADASGKAQEVAALAREQTQQGSRTMGELLHSMDDISKSSKKIEEIMQIIDDIAFQTNLLALNASVEAARAGEHGKGFAVVADAVRSLAQRSADSAKEINNLIGESISKIENGKKSADKSGESMQSILDSIERVSALNTEIAQASHEQTTGISQISKAINDLEQSTMENSGVASQASEYSQKSLTQAEGLMRIVDILEAELDGRSAVSQKNESNFNFDEAVQAHLKWKARLKNFISGMSQEKLESQHICKDNNCPLGKWIYGDGQEYRAFNGYASLKSEHAKFHIAAGDVVKAFERGDVMSANRLLADGSQFDRQTRLTVDAINSLKQEIAASSTSHKKAS